MNPSLREGEQWRLELNGAAQSPPVRIAQLFFGGPAAAARLNPSRSPLGAAVNLEQHKSESLN